MAQKRKLEQDLTWMKGIAITIEARFRCCTLQSTESEFAWLLLPPTFLAPSHCFVHILTASFITSYQFILLSSFATERRVGRSLFYYRGWDIFGDDALEPFRSTKNAPALCCRLENVIDVNLTMVQCQCSDAWCTPRMLRCLIVLMYHPDYHCTFLFLSLCKLVWY